MFAQVAGIFASVAYGCSQCKAASSCGQVTSSYVTVGLSHFRLKKFSHPLRSVGLMKRLQLQLLTSLFPINQFPHAANPAASSGSLVGHSWAKENCNTSKPGAAMSKCGPFAQAGFSLGQKFVPFNTIVVFTPEYPTTLLVPVTFQHLPHPLDIQYPPPKLAEIAAAP